MDPAPAGKKTSMTVKYSSSVSVSTVSGLGSGLVVGEMASENVMISVLKVKTVEIS